MMKSAVRTAYRRYAQGKLPPRIHPDPPEWKLNAPVNTEQSTVWQFCVWMHTMVRPVNNHACTPKQIKHSVSLLPVPGEVRNVLVDMRSIDPENRPGLADVMSKLKRSVEEE